MLKNNIFITIEKIAKKVINKKNFNSSKINLSEDLDSLQMLDLIENLEKTLKIKFNPKDLNYKNFSSLKNLENIIKKK